MIDFMQRFPRKKRLTAGERAPFRTLLLASVLLLTVTPCFGAGPSQESAAATEGNVELPSTETVIARYVEALGGREAIKKHQSLYIKGKVELPHLKLEGEVEQFLKAPNIFRSNFSVPGLSDQIEGHDGKIGWRLERGLYPRVIEGRELKDMLLTAEFYPELTYEQHYPVREVVALEEFAGESCYKLRMVTDWGEETIQFFSVESGLLRGRESWRGPPDEGFAVVEIVSKYEEVDGRLFPMKTVHKFTGIQQIIQMTRVEFNQVDDQVFKLPKEVAELVEKGDSAPVSESQDG